MAALTADKLLKTYQYADVEGIKLDYAVAASTVIYKGGFVGLDTEGNLVMYAKATVGTSIVGNFRLIGIACEHIASQTSAGDKKCQVLVRGRFLSTIASTTIADIGKPVFASTSNSLADLTLTAAGNAYIGYIANFVTVDDCIVEFDPQANNGGMPVSLWSSSIVATVAANYVTVVPRSANPTGLVIYDAYGIATTTPGAAAIFTLYDTAGTSLATTFTFSTSSVASATVPAIVQAAVNSADITATDSALTIVPAGLGVNVKVTTTTATGAAKFFIWTHPIV